jgi:non-specific serine/threonine protein kinase
VSSLAAERPPGNLPAEVTRFIGRRRELAETRTLLDRARLVTLTGVGGVGKTRLALRIAEERRGAFADGAWLVELSALREAELVPRAVAEALGLPDQRAGDPVDRLAQYLSDRHLLLVLDTCEHLVDSCAMLAEILLRAAPRLHILATSREPLEVMGEHTLVIPPLDAPGSGGPPSADSDSVLLFTDRAEAVVRGFTLTDANRETVMRLCNRLDGIPLAIELAAVRLRAMPVEQIAIRLEDRFRILGSVRGGGSRHQTLRAAVEWSHELCTGEERLLWGRLSVFPGAFDLPAAEKVCGGDGLLVFETLGRLVEKSIVLREPEDGRYRMLDTLRDYGAERIQRRGELERLRLLHRDHYLGLAQQTAGLALGAQEIPALVRLRSEHHNLRVALDVSLSTPGEEPAAVRLAGTLGLYWLAFGLFSEGRTWLSRALESSCSAPPRDRVTAMVVAAELAVAQGDLESARALLEAADDIEVPDDYLTARRIQARAVMMFYRADMAGARRLYEDAVARYAVCGYREPAALESLSHLAAVLAMQGDLEGAVARTEEMLARCDRTGEKCVRALGQWMRGVARWLGGDTGGALADFHASLDVKESYGDLLGIACALDMIAACHGTAGRAECAAALFGFTDELWGSLNAPTAGPDYAAIRERVRTEIVGHLGEDRYLAAHHGGTLLSRAEAIDLARNAAPPPGAAASRGPLTARELEIAELVAEGLSNREIAARLTIAKRTADSHMEHILAKLGFASRAQIAAWVERTRRDYNP